MMWGDGFGWGWLMMSFGTILWIAVLIVLVWAIIRWLERRRGVHGQGPATSLNEPSALEILRRRYARGEIDSATFEQMRQQLETSTMQEPQAMRH
jgi:putative membrane protein